MKWPFKIIIITLLFGPVTVLGKDFDSILECLGQEELSLHKNHQLGPVYTLNQTLVNQLAAIGGTALKPKLLREVCESKRLPPSVKLIEILMLKGVHAFQIQKRADESEHFHKMRMGNYETLLSELPHIFYSYLASLQALTPYPFCLQEKIPELNYFTERLQHLEDEVPSDRLIDDRAKLKKVFAGLRRYKSILTECSLLQKELEKKRSRKANP